MKIFRKGKLVEDRAGLIEKEELVILLDAQLALLAD